MDTLLFGHSFTVSLEHYFKGLYDKSQQSIPFPIFVSRHLKVAGLTNGVHFAGIRGGKILENMHLPVEHLLSIKPTIVLMEAGTNDAATLDFSAVQICDQIMAHARALRDLYKVKQVIICGLISRAEGIEMTEEQFSMRARDINTILWVSVSLEKNIQFHYHPGFYTLGANGQKASAWDFTRDGIHPNTKQARHKYLSSMTNAIHKATRAVRKQPHT